MCCSTQQTTRRLNHAIGWAEWKQVLGRGACVALYSRNIKIGRSTNRCRRWCESGSLYSPQCRKWLRPFDAGWGGLAQFIWLANGTTTLRPRYPLIMHPQHIGRAFFRFPDKVSFSWIVVICQKSCVFECSSGSKASFLFNSGWEPSCPTYGWNKNHPINQKHLKHINRCHL